MNREGSRGIGLVVVSGLLDTSTLNLHLLAVVGPDLC